MNETINCPELPTEILLQIFSYLPGNKLDVIREVSCRWKSIIDGLHDKDKIWKDYCLNEFKDMYQVSKGKIGDDFTHYQLYRSLSLWSKLNNAKVTEEDLLDEMKTHEDILNILILPDNIIAVHKYKYISYFDMTTFKEVKRKIMGNYKKYTENNDVLAVLSRESILYVIYRSSYDHVCGRYVINNEIKNVGDFILTAKHIYYTTLREHIYEFDLESKSSTFIGKCQVFINFSLKDDIVYFICFQKNILYKIVDKQILPAYTINNTNPLIEFLNEYNFLNGINMRVAVKWAYSLNLPVTNLKMYYKCGSICLYGNIVFIGKQNGILQIYDACYINGELDFTKNQPIIQIDFKNDGSVDTKYGYNITHIKVVEGIDEHSVYVAMPTKLAVVKLSYDFTNTLSVDVCESHEEDTKECEEQNLPVVDQ